jgi:hypothetical protein
MAQATQMRAPAHYLRVDLSDPAEREYWLVVLDASPEAVQRAVDAVGPDAWDVRQWLRDRRRRLNDGGAACRGDGSAR